MDYPEKEIYTELVARLKAHGYYFEANSHAAPAHYDMDRQQHEDEAGRKEHPFNRPALFFSFGEMRYEPHGSFSKRGLVPITVTVVQDKYVDSADNASDQAAYLKLLEYKYLVNTVLEYFRGTCFSELHLVSVNTDPDNRNLHVETLQYETKCTLLKKTIPPEPAP